MLSPSYPQTYLICPIIRNNGINPYMINHTSV